nr:hypothetical protein A4A49_63750 [Ipomoea trifida]
MDDHVSFGWRNFTHQLRRGFIAMQHQPGVATSFLSLFGFAFSAILNFLQLKYQGTDQPDPFQTHPRTMLVAVSSLLIFCFIYGLNQRFSSHSLYRSCEDIVCIATVFFPLLSLLSTASVLFPDSVRPVLYVLCVLISAGECLQWIFQKIKNQLREREGNGWGFQQFANNLGIRRFIGFPSMTMANRSLLPL